MPATGGLSKAEAQNKFLDAIAAGMTIKDAMASVKRAPKTHENWLLEPEFNARYKQVRDARAAAKLRGSDPDAAWMPFAEWRKEFLDQETYPHQQDWIDLIEGRDPSWLHPAMTYEPRDPSRLIINTPPYHSKSTTVTIEYVTYRICMDPEVRIIIISKTQTKAKEFLYAIQQRLTSNRFAKLQATYAPEGGFKPDKDGGAWTAVKFYVAGVDTGSPTPTVEALGIGGQIYGSRSDLIILDDCVTNDNAAQYESQIRWIESEVDSRLDPENGKLLIIGTRLASQDLYGEFRQDERYVDGESPWTYMAQPMVLEFHENVTDWVTLWPKSTKPLGQRAQPDADGLYTTWDGPRCARERAKRSPSTWSLVYMQQETPEDATFDPVCVQGSVNGQRKPGPLVAGAFGHPRLGPEGMRIVMSIDPAGTGKAFVIIVAIDPKTQIRYVLNAWTADNTTPSWYLRKMEETVDAYGYKDVVIESNAYASWLIHDEAVRALAARKGLRIIPHFTQHNKQDPDFGVASLSTLFGTTRKSNDGAGRRVHNRDNLILLPDPGMSEGIRALIAQLITWRPGVRGGKLVQDGPMALWFAELRIRDIIKLTVSKSPIAGMGDVPKSAFSTTFSFSGPPRAISLEAAFAAAREPQEAGVT